MRPTALILLLLTACSGIDSPTHSGLPQVSFQPAPGPLLLAQGGRQRFVARDEHGKALRAEFRVGGVRKHVGMAYDWNALALGSHLIEAEVDLGEFTRTGVWTVDVQWVDPHFVPPVEELRAAPGERWATLELRWNRTQLPQLHVSISGYRIYFAQSPYASIHDAHVATQDVEDDPSGVEQQATLFDLDPQLDCFVQVVAINANGSASPASAQLVARSRGSGSIDLPPPSALSVEVPPEFGALLVHWTAPQLEATAAPLESYRVYWDDAAFTPDRLAAVASTSLPATGEQMSQRIEGLASDTLYHFRVQAFASDGRSSALSAPVTGRTRLTPTQLTLSGRALAIDWTLGQLRGLPEARLIAGAAETLSDAAGDWVLPTATHGELTLISDTQGAHYAAKLPILGGEDRQLDVLFLPKRTVQIESSNPLLHGPMSDMEFLHRMTGTRYGSPLRPGRIHRWESYPVPVQRSTHQHQGSELVDYALSYERGAAAWNAALGRSLIELVDHEPAIGVSVAVDVPAGGAVLGELRFSDPPNGWFTDDVPRRARIHLAQFYSQELADRVIQHEIGHVLGLLHSPSEDHVMHSTAPALAPSPDEARIGLLIALLPQAMPLTWYEEQ